MMKYITNYQEKDKLLKLVLGQQTSWGKQHLTIKHIPN